MLLVHLLHHENSADAPEECRLETLHQHLQWGEAFTRQVVRHAGSRQLVAEAGALLQLSEAGRDLAQQAVVGSAT
jgi:hypothetical protein